MKTTMAKRVLVAIDLEGPELGAITYGRQLAVRLGATLMLLGVAGGGQASLPQDSTAISPEELHHGLRWQWEKMVSLCRQEAPNLEVFLSAGRFWEEVSQFLKVQPSVQFLVVGAPQDSSDNDFGVLDFVLRNLKRDFPGEILVVQEQGKITHQAEPD